MNLASAYAAVAVKQGQLCTANHRPLLLARQELAQEAGALTQSLYIGWRAVVGLGLGSALVSRLGLRFELWLGLRRFFLGR